MITMGSAPAERGATPEADGWASWLNKGPGEAVGDSCPTITVMAPAEAADGKTWYCGMSAIRPCSCTWVSFTATQRHATQIDGDGGRYGR